MHISIYVLVGFSRAREIPLKREDVIIGRGKGCKIRIASPDVSRQHCRIKVRGTELVLWDLGSVNGTFVNGQLIHGEHVLRPRDRIRVGPVTLEVDFDSRTQALEAVPVDEAPSMQDPAGDEIVILDDQEADDRRSTRKHKRPKGETKRRSSRKGRPSAPLPVAEPDDEAVALPSALPDDDAATELQRGFTEKDNRGRRQQSLEDADVFWAARRYQPHKPPFVLGVFKKKLDAKRALLELPCMHLARDTRRVVCSLPLDYGYYPVENGDYEALVCGDDLTVDLWERARDAFVKYDGQIKGELVPEKPPVHEPPDTGVHEQVEFVRDECRADLRGMSHLYHIYKAPDAAAALAFLQDNPINQASVYLVVETPEGNYCRDRKGVFKEVEQANPDA